MPPGKATLPHASQPTQTAAGRLFALVDALSSLGAQWDALSREAAPSGAPETARPDAGDARKESGHDG